MLSKETTSSVAWNVVRQYLLSFKRGRDDSETHCTGKFISSGVCYGRSASSFAAAPSFSDRSTVELLPSTPNNAFTKPLSSVAQIVAEATGNGYREAVFVRVASSAQRAILRAEPLFMASPGSAVVVSPLLVTFGKTGYSDCHWLIVTLKPFDIRPGSCLVDTEKPHRTVNRQDADRHQGLEGELSVSQSRQEAGRSGVIYLQQRSR